MLGIWSLIIFFYFSCGFIYWSCPATPTKGGRRRQGASPFYKPEKERHFGDTSSGPGCLWVFITRLKDDVKLPKKPWLSSKKNTNETSSESSPSVAWNPSVLSFPRLKRCSSPMSRLQGPGRLLPLEGFTITHEEIMGIDVTRMDLLWKTGIKVRLEIYWE